MFVGENEIWCSSEVLDNSSASAQAVGWSLSDSLCGMECVEVSYLQPDDRGCDLLLLMVVVLLISFDDELIQLGEEA